jgi:hypothetical protein
MSEHQIFLSEEIYANLLAAAQAEGISPTEWIAAKLPNVSQSCPPGAKSSRTVEDLLGAINSQKEPHQTYQKTAFGEALAVKLAKQGINRS